MSPNVSSSSCLSGILRSPFPNPLDMPSFDTAQEKRQPSFGIASDAAPAREPFERIPLLRARLPNCAVESDDLPDSDGHESFDCYGTTPTHIHALHDRMRSGSMTPEPPFRRSSSSAVTSREFGVLNGETVHIYTLTNGSGMSVSVITYGATIWKLHANDRGGILQDVVCGFDTLEEYTQSDLALGALCVGRPAGGLDGFHRVIWRVVEDDTNFNEAFVRLQHASAADGAELTLELTIILTRYECGGHCAQRDGYCTTFVRRLCWLMATSWSSTRRSALVVIVVMLYFVRYLLKCCILCVCGWQARRVDPRVLGEERARHTILVEE